MHTDRPGGEFLHHFPSSQRALAVLCSSTGEGEKGFPEGDWKITANGLPYLSDAQAVFACKSKKSFADGTHSIYIGDVEYVMTHGSVDPLVYVDGRYAALIGL
jgi:flavin reductase (DIM6/NTAB) family NADH-FMN oxidoreductase RutF